MGWVHDTGYRPAYAHEGYVALVADDGTDSDGVRVTGAHVVGWRAACSCGWRATQVHHRADYPDDPAALRGAEPDAVDGWEPDAPAPVDGVSCYAAWQDHLAETLPELAVHDAVAAHREAAARIETAVATAREAGASWGAIGDAAGISRQSAWERWHHT